MTRIGVIGLGNMGSRMARRLAGGGFEVVGYDVAEVAVPGVARCEGLADIAAKAETLILSLPDGAASMAVCRGLAKLATRTVTTVVDTSTIGPDAAIEAHGILAAGGMTYVDAPVSGGVPGAEAGTLALMAGTDPGTFERLDPILAPIAAKRFRVGDRPGQGQAMKLLNNFLSATALIATSEAVAFGVSQGLDPALIIDVLNVSSGRNTASSDKFPRSVLPGTYDYGFATKLMRKDVALYAAAVERTGTASSVGEAVADAWRRFEAADPASDFTRVYEWVKSGRHSEER